MPDHTLPFDATLGLHLGPLIVDARRLIGWSQASLAMRSGTSQSTISRIEAGKASALDVLVVERILRALGMRLTIGVDARHLADRRRQADGIHARLVGYEDRRLVRLRWQTALEVELPGPHGPRGWIDLMAFRETDRALIVDETKGELDDMGALQRSLAFYEREAWAAARRLGWHPRSVTVICVALDSEAVARRVDANRDVVARAFPAHVAGTAAWIASPDAPRPAGWTLAVADPLYRGAKWLKSTVSRERRTVPAYRDYAEAARLMLRG
jgi:transcriptional regulator with XRE-family HTH domain